MIQLKLATKLNSLQNNLEGSLPYVKTGQLPRDAELKWQHF